MNQYHYLPFTNQRIEEEKKERKEKKQIIRIKKISFFRVEFTSPKPNKQKSLKKARYQIIQVSNVGESEVTLTLFAKYIRMFYKHSLGCNDCFGIKYKQSVEIGYQRYCSTHAYGYHGTTIVIRADSLVSFRSTDLFQNLKKTNKFQQSCLITTNIFYLLFYIIDNVAILSKIQFLKFDYRKVKKYGYPMWLIGLLSALIYYIIKLKQSFKKEAELKTVMLNNMTPKEFCQAILQITEERKNYSLNIIRIVGDMIVALQRNNIPEFVLHTRFNRGLVAFGGLLSSIISFYQFYSKNKKLIQQQK